LLGGCASGSPAPTPSRDLVHLTILQVNDVYALEPVDGGRSGGLARLATLVREERRRNPATLFLLAGDLISPSVMSTVLRGEQMITAFNAVGLDLATFGNHEFDFGPDVLATRVRESKFAWVSSNVVDAAGRPFGGARTDSLVELGGLKVGVFGLTLAETAHLSSAGTAVRFLDPFVAGREAAARLRQAGAHVVVGLTHMEMAQDRELARRVDVDVIVGGHEHEPLVAEERKTLITKAGSDARYLLRIDLWLTREGRLVERSWMFRHVSARVEADPSVAELVRGYTAKLAREMAVVVGRTTVPLDARSARVRTEETNVGNFIADAARRAVDAQVALVNGGGIRGDRVIPAGPLTRGDVIGLLPFANTLVKLQVTGRVLREAIEHGLSQTDRVAGGYLQVSGARLAWDPRRPAGRRIVRIDVDGRALDDGGRYVVAVPSYLFGGGDGYAFRDATVLVSPESGPDLAALVVEATTEAGSIAPTVDGRVIRVSD
jgi:5'-nucleotidase